MVRHFKPLCSGTTQSFQHQPHSLSHQLRHQIQMLWMIFFPKLTSPMQATATVGKCQMYLIVWSLFQHTVTNGGEGDDEVGSERADKETSEQDSEHNDDDDETMTYAETFKVVGSSFERQAWSICVFLRTQKKEPQLDVVHERDNI